MSQFVRSRAHPPYPPSVRERTNGRGFRSCEGERWTFTVEALPDQRDGYEVPPEQRLRQLLKIALRGLRLRCVSMKRADVPIEPQDAPAGQETPAMPLVVENLR